MGIDADSAEWRRLAAVSGNFLLSHSGCSLPPPDELSCCILSCFTIIFVRYFPHTLSIIHRPAVKKTYYNRCNSRYDCIDIYNNYRVQDTVL